MYFNCRTFNLIDMIDTYPLEVFCIRMNITGWFRFKCYLTFERRTCSHRPYSGNNIIHVRPCLPDKEVLQRNFSSSYSLYNEIKNVEMQWSAPFPSTNIKKLWREPKIGHEKFVIINLFLQKIVTCSSSRPFWLYL